MTRIRIVWVASTCALLLAVAAAWLAWRAHDSATDGSGGSASAHTSAARKLQALPGPGTTGAPAASPARSIHQDVTLDAAKSSLRDATVTGTLVIQGDDVTIDNVVVKATGPYGIQVYGERARITNSTIVGTPGQTMVGLASIEGGSFAASRLDVHSSEDGVRLGSDCSLVKSWVHDLAGTSSSHYDAVTAEEARNWRIAGNRISNPHDQTSAVTVGDKQSPTEGTLEDNYLEGGGYVIYAGRSVGSGLVIRNNYLSTKVFPEGGKYGPVAYWEPAGNNTWTNNVWTDGSKVLNQVPEPR